MNPNRRIVLIVAVYMLRSISETILLLPLHLSTCWLYLVPDLVEDVHVSFHFWGEKVESSVTFDGSNDNMVLFESANMMLRDSVVSVECFSQLVGLFCTMVLQRSGRIPCAGEG